LPHAVWSPDPIRPSDPIVIRKPPRRYEAPHPFFWSKPAFTHELLLIYFFVIWLDRQPDGGREVAPRVTEQVNRGGQDKSNVRNRRLSE